MHVLIVGIISKIGIYSDADARTYTENFPSITHLVLLFSIYFVLIITVRRQLCSRLR